MEKQEKYESIEAYLEGNLSSEALKDFQQRLKNDRTFAKEVALHQRLHAELGDPTKRRLRGILSDLSAQKHLAAAPAVNRQLRVRTNRKKWMAIAAGLLLIAMTTWYFLSRNPVDTPLITDEKKPATQPIEPVQPIEQQKEIPSSPIEKNTPNSPENLADEKGSKKKNATENPLPKTPKEPQTIPAVDPYLANAEIENLLSNAPANPFEFVIDFPEEKTTIAIREDGKASFGFLATLFTDQFPENDNFVLQLFDNQLINFQNNRPVFQTKLNFEKEESQTDLAYAEGEKAIYYVNQQERIEIKPGLYYWKVTLENEEKTIVWGITSAVAK